MSNFDWQAEDDAHWAESHEQSPQSTSKNLRFLLPIFTLAVMGLFGWVAWRQVNTTVDKAVESAEVSIQSSFDLFFAKVSEGDIEVVNSLLMIKKTLH